MAACRRLVAPIAACAIAAATACAPKRVELPSGAATPFADAAAAYEQAVQECRGARTIQATLGLSGRAGTMKLRGSVDAGFEAPEKVRLEGRHPLGRPVFILVAAPEATLFLPRENRVLRNVGAAEIVEALVGVPLGGGELRSLVSGCGFAVAEPSQGRSYAAGWVAVDTGDSTTYLRQVDGRWRVAAASRPPLVVHYSAFVLGRPTVLRLQASDASKADLTVRLSDVNINVPLEPQVFEVNASGADPLTLEELRRAGPLGGPSL